MARLGKNERARRLAAKALQAAQASTWSPPTTPIATPVDPRQIVARLGERPAQVIRTKSGRLEILRGAQSSITD